MNTMNTTDRGRVLKFGVETDMDGHPWGHGVIWIREADLLGKSRPEARKFVGDWCQALYEQFMARWAELKAEQEER